MHERIVTSFNDVHSLKIPIPIEVADGGILILVSDLHPLKA